MTIALVLGGGAPNLTLMAGAVAALDDAGVEFDVVSTSGAGMLIGLLYAAPKGRRGDIKRDRGAFCCGAFRRDWHKADMPLVSLDVRFSNRPSGVKRFQAIHQLQCRCRSRALASLRTRHQGPFHHGIRRRGGTIFRATLPSM